MPYYEYECNDCKKITEELQRLSEPPITTCPTCGGALTKKFPTNTSFQLKGSGWFITDYPKNKS